MSEPFLGQITMFGGNFAPRGWAFCNGQLLAISSNTALFSLLGTTYGGDGRTTFGLPDLRGRVPMHSGNSAGPGLTFRTLGTRLGTERETLTISQMPSHNHVATVHCFNGPGNSNVAQNNVWSKDLGVQSATYNTNAPNAQMKSGAATVGNTGGGQAQNNMQPSLAINFIIALIGIFPSRN